MSNEMIFCTYCNNLMYAQEDLRLKQLKFICHQCDGIKYADRDNPLENCVEQLNFNNRPEENILVAENLMKDPTMGRIYDYNCDACGGHEALFFQLPERMNDDAMALVFVCCNENCGKWKKQAKELDNDKPKDPFQSSFMDSPSHPLDNQTKGFASHGYQLKTETR